MVVDMIKLKIIGFSFLLGIVLSACSFSLAADVTPPPNYQPPAVEQTPVIQKTVMPMFPPDLANGKAIYTDKCTDCHGENGMGDGPQAGQLPNAVAPIGSIDLAQQSNPVKWFNIITNGNIEKFMPGFASLNDRERWDVTAYLFSLSMPKNVEVEGSVLFEEHCVICHSSGNEKGASDFKDAALLVPYSQVYLEEMISQGVGEVMPGFSDTLNQNEIQTLVHYIRLLGFQTDLLLKVASTQVPDVEGTPVTIITAETLEESPVEYTIKGNLLNLEKIPDNLVVVLSAYDGMELSFERETEVQIDGYFQFEQIENKPGRVIQLSVTIDGLRHVSEVLHDPVINDVDEVELPIEIRSVSSDSSVLFSERMHVFFDFSVDGFVQIVQLFVVNNPTDKIIVPTSSDQPVMNYSLPTGFLNLQFEDGVLGERYIQTSTGFGDLSPIEANTTVQVIFAYELPYQRNLDLTLTLPMAVEASIFMLPANSVKLKSDQVIFAGDRTVQGMQIQTYSANRLENGTEIKLNLNGRTQSSVVVATTSNTPGLLIGVGFLLIVIIAGGVWYFRKYKRSQTETEMLEEEDQGTILDAIIVLDDAFKSGDIPEEAYLARRTELVSKLKKNQGAV
jgi:mono/diheme cytochrome c family protein